MPRGIASPVYALALLVLLFISTGILAQGDEITLQTDKEEYKVGETIFFTGSGYVPSGTHYNITVSWYNETSNEYVSVAYVEFISTEGGIIPSDTSLLIPFDALDGTYSACVYNITTVPIVGPLACAEFSVNASEGAKLEYTSGALEGLIEAIEGGIEEDETGLRQSLLSSLENAAKKVENATQLFVEGEYKQAANQLRVARNMLTAFVHKVAASSERIGAELASELIEKAMDLLSKVDSLLTMILEEAVPLGKKLSLNMRRTLTKQELNLNEFVLRKYVDEASDEELSAFLESNIDRLEQLLDRMKSKKEEFEGLEDLELHELTIVLEDLEASDNLLHLWEVFMRQLEEKGKLNPGLAKKFGELLDSADATSGPRGLTENRGKAWGREGTPPGQEKKNKEVGKIGKAR
ncbi:MAG: hypothetical protein ACUVQY_08940 [Thermoproteota archaeon]